MASEAQKLDPARSARELYGAELRRQRQLAGMSLDRLSDIVNYSKTQLHGVETAERLPLPPLSAKLDAAFGTGGLFEGLWSIIQRERYPDRYRRFMELADQATDIHEYAGHLVPGLLQTPAYARALLRVGDPEASGEEIERKVAVRVGRQGRLRDGDGPYLWTLLEEGVLRRPVGGPATMREQLRALLSFAESPRIEVQVIPYVHGEHALLDSTLTLLTLPNATAIAYLESNYSGQLIEDPTEAMKRRRAYDLLRANALSPRESAAMIEAAMEGFNPCEQLD
ncbi:helix-turn-helix domain-containing protein [Streptomyces hygroscopicus]|uniref:helix-turn-helix domain-containing protein n=1 Tax=Streptomyces hygroscopicus TaxID=1912 RepID=UPI0007DB14DB|nr:MULTISPECIES: helix-turn-helix transcriptional regulator [Streptomyces]